MTYFVTLYKLETSSILISRTGKVETGMASKDNNTESDSEFLLMTKNDLTFAATDSLLTDPNV